MNRDDPGLEAAAAEVMQAALELVTAFASHDVERYFDAFAAEATFLFHSAPDLIHSRADYRALWTDWEGHGFRVLCCRSESPRVDLFTPDIAIFTHVVRIRVADEQSERRERETIVFRHEPNGRWLAVHEHLSKDPNPN